MHLQPTALKYLFLDLNSYFASVEQQLNPALRGKPVAVVPVESDATCAIAASYEAKAFGIRTGTPIWEAKKLCPELVCVYAEHHKYVEFHHAIQQEIDQYIPVLRVASIDEFAFELQGSQCTEEGALKLAHQIKKGMAESPRVGPYIRASIGISTNQFLAKVATNLQKPNGLVILKPHEMPGRVAHWSLKDLPGIGRNMYRRLLQAGIGDIETFFHLQPKRARAVWGSVEGERFWYKLHGVELPEFPTEKRTIGHSHVLAPELRPVAQAWMVAQRLTLKAASRVRRARCVTGGLCLSVRVENGPGMATEMRFAPVNDTVSLLQSLLVLWRALVVEQNITRVKKVSVTCFNLCEEGASYTGNLFQQSEETFTLQCNKRHASLSTALDTLNRRFGRDTVVMGFTPHKVRSFSGTKVAFTRIPDMEEFHE